MKADALSRVEGNKVIIPPEAQEHYFRAINVLEEGARIDRSFNEVNRAKQILRGDPQESITEVGLAPVYDTLAICYARVGRYDIALTRLAYSRQLDPTEPETHIKIGRLYLEQKQYDEAAVAFLEAMLVTRDSPTAWQGLIQTYKLMGPEGDNAIIVQNGVPMLNLDHVSKAYEHLQLAYRELIRAMRWAHRFAAAEQLRNAAVNVQHLPPKMLDEMLTEPVPTVTPDGVLYDQVQPWSAGKAPLLPNPQ
jgi:tetratricopeptide (TPR) repeat protein